MRILPHRVVCRLVVRRPAARCHLSGVRSRAASSCSVSVGLCARQITSKVVKSGNSEPEASRVPQAVKGEKISQLSAEKGMDEAATESVAESWDGDGLASGAVCFRAMHGRLQLHALYSHMRMTPHAAHGQRLARLRTAAEHAPSGHQAWPVEPRSACHTSRHLHHRTPRPARVSASVRRSGPPTGHRRAAGGDATTVAPPIPDRRATWQRGGFLAVAIRARGDLHKISTRGVSKQCLFTFAFSQTLRVAIAPAPRGSQCTVKWYRIDADWYKPDRALSAQR